MAKQHASHPQCKCRHCGHPSTLTVVPTLEPGIYNRNKRCATCNRPYSVPFKVTMTNGKREIKILEYPGYRGK